MGDMFTRYYNLTDSVIKKYCDLIDFENPDSIALTMIGNLLEGNLDDDFYSLELEGIDNKKDAYDLARKYHSLCMFQGNDKYWKDSVEGVTCQDIDAVMIKLLDNYNFLLRIAVINPSIFPFLTDIQDKRIISDSSVIDCLRNIYNNDDNLLMILNSMIDENSVFNDYSLDKKAVLCMNPSVILEDNKLRSEEYIRSSFDSKLSFDDFRDKVLDESIKKHIDF